MSVASKDFTIDLPSINRLLRRTSAYFRAVERALHPRRGDPIRMDPPSADLADELLGDLARVVRGFKHTLAKQPTQQRLPMLREDHYAALIDIVRRAKSHAPRKRAAFLGEIEDRLKCASKHRERQRSAADA